MFSEPTESPRLETVERDRVLSRFQRVRAFTEELCAPLEPEDCIVQSMPDASPTRWHLAHTTWFFETFLLKAHIAGYSSPEPAYEILFNSYYNEVGEQFPRSRRGLLSRPTVAEVFEYRSRIDSQVQELIEDADDLEFAALASVLETGCQHEQQHQELMLTDIKNAFSCNPMSPVYWPRKENSDTARSSKWIHFDGGLFEIGHDGPEFAFDNEIPRHSVFLAPFDLANRLTTNSEFIEFIESGGYERPEFWLSEGWDKVRTEDWRAPLYWSRQDGSWTSYTLAGRLAVNPAEPVTHVSYFEADAYARWAGARLATEAEWEHAAASVQRSDTDHFVDAREFQPRVLSNDSGRHVEQLYGDVWEWTSSSYSPYPGFKPEVGALGEYNGKFMCNQYVLRGGSCASSRDHIRASYRNFFAASCRWQFSGVRLAR